MRLKDCSNKLEEFSPPLPYYIAAIAGLTNLDGHKIVELSPKPDGTLRESGLVKGATHMLYSKCVRHSL
jgi:hypothetical protein